MSIHLHLSVSQQTSLVHSKEETLLTSLDQLHGQLPQYDLKTIQSLANIHRGPEEGSMQTLGLVRTIRNDETFMIDERSIKQCSELFAIDLEKEASNPPIVEIPSHLEFKAEWNDHAVDSGTENNILGDNGRLYLESSHLQIPAVKATKETLAYYGAVLISENTAIRFPNEEPYPLWEMLIGPNYIRDFMMHKEHGNGFYLEYHHDQPHFHMVLDGGGHYLLAKKVKEDTFQITAFELCNGQAIYTKKGAIHCDAALVGRLIVGYTVSENCSTVLLHTKTDNQIVNVEFVNAQ